MTVLTRLRIAGHPDYDARSLRLLDEMRSLGFNHDPAREAEFTPANGWQIHDRRQALPPGSWDVARRLMRGYEFADPSISHAVYDPDEPLEGRTMLLELRLWGALRVDVGVRVTCVYEEDRVLDGREGHVWGWAYRTLEGHVEMGRMDWQVWKWPGSEEVLFRVHSYSKRAVDRDLVVQLGFRLFGRREQAVFLDSTCRRMAALTEAARDPHGDVHAVAEACTAHGHVDTSAPHARLVGYARMPANAGRRPGSLR